MLNGVDYTTWQLFPVVLSCNGEEENGEGQSRWKKEKPLGASYSVSVYSEEKMVVGGRGRSLFGW